MSIGDFRESLSQAMLVGTMLVGRLDVLGVGSSCVVPKRVAIICYNL